MDRLDLSQDIRARLSELSRQNGETEERLLRRLLGLAGGPTGVGSAAAKPGSAGFEPGFEDATYGIHFSEGFEISRTYKGRPYAARVARGRWLLDADGRAYDSLNQLSQAVIDGNENAWMFWFYQTPDGSRRRIAELRDPALVQRRPRRKRRSRLAAPVPGSASAPPPSTPTVAAKAASTVKSRPRPPLDQSAPPTAPRPSGSGMAWEPAPKPKQE
jgi:hypothetical protein